MSVSTQNAADRQRSLRMLDELIATPEDGKRRRRRSDLLVAKAPDDPLDLEPMDASWAFALLPALREAIDVRLTTRTVDKRKTEELTQGANFGFEAGTLIYDDPAALAEPWGRALGAIRHCLQIELASPAAERAGDGGRDPGLVRFRVYAVADSAATDPELRYVETRETTQDEFVRLLIAGLD